MDTTVEPQTPPPPAPRVVAVPSALAMALAVAIVAVSVVYREALTTQFFNDDFHWLADARRFAWPDLVRLDRYDHFYRPVVLVYFHLAQRLVGCDPWPFHAASVALHAFNTWILAAFAWTLTRNRGLTAAGVLLFAVQPGYVEAVVWVGAVTDLLPATWVLLALWLHLRFLQQGARWAYAGALTAFALCLGTHETAVTIPPMLLALDVLVTRPRLGDAVPWLRTRVTRYLPHALLLLLFLAVAYIVNSRSYLVREGHYGVGLHALRNVFEYIAGLYVGRRRPLWHAAVAGVMALIAWRGTPRLRFFLVWMLVTLLPVSFFTWGTASRYLYVPAAGFALLLAEAITLGAERMSRRVTAPAVHAGAALLVIVLAARFAMFATGGVRDFRELAEPYGRLIAAVREHTGAMDADGRVPVSAADVADLPPLYLDPAAETALCRTGVHVTVAE